MIVDKIERDLIFQVLETEVVQHSPRKRVGVDERHYDFQKRGLICAPKITTSTKIMVDK